MAETPTLNSKEIRWHVLAGLVALGFTAGLFAGLSESPVGTTLIAGLFGLLGGGGFLTLALRHWTGDAEGKTSRPPDPNLIKLGAHALVALCLAAIIGAVIGMGTRQGWLFGSAGDPLLQSVTQAARDRSPNEQLQLLIMQTEMRKLGAPPQDINALVTAYAAAGVPAEAPPEDDRPSVRRARASGSEDFYIDAAVEEAEEAISTLRGAPDERGFRRVKTPADITQGELEEIDSALNAIASHLSRLRHEHNTAEGSDLETAVAMVERFRGDGAVEEPKRPSMAP